VTTRPGDVRANPLIAMIIKEADSTDKRWTLPTAFWRRVLVFRPLLKDRWLWAYMVDKVDKRLIDHVLGAKGLRSLTMEGFVQEVHKKIMTRRLFGDNMRAFMVVADLDGRIRYSTMKVAEVRLNGF